MLSEIIQTQKEKYHIISLRLNILNRQIIETERSCWRLGTGMSGELLLNGCRVSNTGAKMFVEIMVVVAQHCECDKSYWTVNLKMVRVRVAIFCSIYLTTILKKKQCNILKSVSCMVCKLCLNKAIFNNNFWEPDTMYNKWVLK